ncbi:MAG: OB-fold protein [Christensenellales bacterium]|jgi:hypothetical protein
MKRVLLVVMILSVLSCWICSAEEVFLSDFTTSELNTLSERIDDEYSANHTATSGMKSKVEKSVKAFIEDFYGGSENVEWPWFNYTYSREWDYVTMNTNAKIVKPDGGRADYNVYAETYLVEGKYTTIYVKIGNEVIWDEREKWITDARVLNMLGLHAAPDAKAKLADSEPEEHVIEEHEPVENEEQEEQEPIIAKRGDMSENASSVQKLLIKLGYLDGKADGSFGKKTETAVIKYQAANGMEQTGIVTQSVYDSMQEDADSIPDPITYPTYTARELYKMYSDNAIAADEAVRGKTIIVTGTVYDIGSSFGIPYIMLDGGGFLEHVQCDFPMDAKSELAKIRKNQKVKIRGECTGIFLLTPTLDDCEFVD